MSRIRGGGGGGGGGSSHGCGMMQLTAMKVAGRKSMVKNAMDRIWLESCLVSLAISRFACVSW